MYGIIQPTVAKLHLLLHPPLVEDHLIWETIFIWIQVQSLKRGTTVTQLVEQSHRSSDGRGFDSHLSCEIFSFWINLRTSLYTSVIYRLDQ